jgi:hypothetical protein
MACVNGVQERRQGRVGYFNNAVFSPSLLTRKNANEERTLVIRPDYINKDVTGVTDLLFDRPIIIATGECSLWPSHPEVKVRRYPCTKPITNPLRG